MSWKTAVLETGFEISSLNCCWWFWPLPISPTAWPSLKPSVEVHMSTVSQGTWEICVTLTNYVPWCVWAKVSATCRCCKITVLQPLWHDCLKQSSLRTIEFILISLPLNQNCTKSHKVYTTWLSFFILNGYRKRGHRAKCTAACRKTRTESCGSFVISGKDFMKTGHMAWKLFKNNINYS